MGYSLHKQVRKLQTSKNIGGNFGVELSIASRAVLAKDNSIAYDPDTPGALLLKDVDTGVVNQVYIKDGALKFTAVGNALTAIALALFLALGFGHTAKAQSTTEMVFSSTVTGTGTAGTVLPLNTIINTGTNFIVNSVDVLVLSSSAITRAPVLTFISGTNTATTLTGTGTILSGTVAGQVTRYTAVNPIPSLTATNLSLYIPTTGTATTLNLEVIQKGYYAP